jgi:O-antigen ligase
MPKQISVILASLTILLMPLYVVRFQVGPIPTTLLELLILVTTAVWVIELWMSQEGLVLIWYRVSHPLFWWGVALVLVGLISVIPPADHRTGLGLWRAYFLEPFIFSVIIIELSRRLKSVNIFLWSLLLSGLWLAIIGISQVLWQVPVTPDSYHEVIQGRAAAVFNSANSLALFLGPVFAVSVFWALSARRYYYWVIATVLFLGILATRSEGARIGLGAIEFLIILNFLWGRIKPNWRQVIWKGGAAAGALSLAALVVLFFNVSLFTPKTHFTYPRIYNDTKTIRLCLWEGTRNIIEKSPLVGTGLGGFKSVYIDNRTCDSEPLEYPHNIFLNFWVEVGLVGLLIFLLIQIRVWQILRASPNRYLAVGIAGAFAFQIVHGLVDVPYFKNDLATLWWVLVSLAILAKENKLQFARSE